MRAAIRNILLGTKSVIPPILDTLSAAAAYSLRLLRTAYTGFCIRVRRSSDNTEQNIGFVGGVLDTVNLLAFVGVGNGFIVTWFDQSGNARNATQATAANQLRIVNAGVLEVQNTKPSIVQAGINAWLNLPNIMAGASSATGFIVYSGSNDFGDSNFRGWGSVNGDGTLTHTPFGDSTAYDSFCSGGRQSFTGYGISTNLGLHTVRHTGSALQCFKNGTQIDTDKTIGFKNTPSTIDRLFNGATDIPTATLRVHIPEAVFFGSAISTADRQLLEANQKAYYGTP